MSQFLSWSWNCFRFCCNHSDVFFWMFCGLIIYKTIVHFHLGFHKIIWLFGSLLTVFFIVCGNRCLLLVSLGVQFVATQCHCLLCVAMGVLFWLDRFCVHILHKTGQCVLKNYADLHSMWLVALCSVLCLYIILLHGMCFVIKYLCFVVYVWLRCPFLPLLIHAYLRLYFFCW